MLIKNLMMMMTRFNIVLNLRDMIGERNTVITKSYFLLSHTVSSDSLFTHA